jgi:hypothetical protein
MVMDREFYINKIGGEYLLKGTNDPTKIAKDLGIPRKDVVLYIAEWRKAAKDSDVKERAIELLWEMDKSYDQLINELWIVHAEAIAPRDKNAALKTISEIIAKRQEVLQKAGLYDDAEMGDALALAEEQMEGIKALLKAVASEHPAARQMIMDGLGRIFHQAVST